MNRVRTLLAELWYRRPVLTTHARIHNRVDEANVAGYLQGHAYAQTHGEDYTAGYLTGWAAGVAAKKTARLTPTGHTLQAV